MTRMLIVSKREYIKTVRKPAFWLGTLAFPILIGILSLISGASSGSVEARFEELATKASDVIVVDDSGLIVQAILPETYQVLDTKDEGISKIQSGQNSALIYYPEDVLESSKVEVYYQSQGVFGENIFDKVATSLLNNSIQADIQDPAKIKLLNSQVSVESTIYKDGEVVSSEVQKLIVPGVSVIIYFIMVFLSTNFMLMSVSEEKENRMVETILTVVDSRSLIFGKIIGYIGVAITQFSVLAILIFLMINLAGTKLPVELIPTDISLGQVVGAIFYILAGFLMLSSIMVGVGSAMPNYRDAQSFSTVFVMLSILPIYFVAILVAEPSGLVAIISSYFPLTAPIILMFRNSLGELGMLELLISSVLLVLYVLAAMWLAFKLFEFGSLEYSQRISWKRFFRLVSQGKGV